VVLEEKTISFGAMGIKHAQREHGEQQERLRGTAGNMMGDNRTLIAVARDLASWLDPASDEAVRSTPPHFTQHAVFYNNS